VGWGGGGGGLEVFLGIVGGGCFGGGGGLFGWGGGGGFVGWGSRLTMTAFESTFAPTGTLQSQKKLSNRQSKGKVFEATVKLNPREGEGACKLSTNRETKVNEKKLSREGSTKKRFGGIPWPAEEEAKIFRASAEQRKKKEPN